jgi:hypothetical protein
MRRASVARRFSFLRAAASLAREERGICALPCASSMSSREALH